MPLFEISGSSLKATKKVDFKTEKELQLLIEKNLEVVFNCRLVASEYPTGPQHAGRIDSLALSEDDNPVIIEYKKVESSDLITQSLFYMAWLNDHRGDYEMAAQKALGKSPTVDWSDIRVICLAPGYRKYDLHAVTMMGANIELWQYRRFDNGGLYLEEIYRKFETSSPSASQKKLVQIEAGKKAAITRATGDYSFEEHAAKGSVQVKAILEELREAILQIDETIEEAPKKFYIAYKVSQNFVCLEVKQNKLLLYLKLDPGSVQLQPNMRDVSNVGHFGTGDLEFTITKPEQIAEALPLIRSAFQGIGG